MADFDCDQCGHPMDDHDPETDRCDDCGCTEFVAPRWVADQSNTSQLDLFGDTP